MAIEWDSFIYGSPQGFMLHAVVIQCNTIQATQDHDWISKYFFRVKVKAVERTSSVPILFFFRDKYYRPIWTRIETKLVWIKSNFGDWPQTRSASTAKFSCGTITTSTWGNRMDWWVKYTDFKSDTFISLRTYALTLPPCLRRRSNLLYSIVACFG